MAAPPAGLRLRARRAAGRCPHPPGAPVRPPVRAALDGARDPGGEPAHLAAGHGVGRSAAGDAGGGGTAVRPPGQPEGGDIRRDVLRQGRLGDDPPGLRSQLAQGCRQVDPRESRRRAAPPGPRLRRPPAGRQMGDRARRVDVRLRPLRLAVHDGRARHPVGADAVPDRPPAVPLHLPRLPGRRAARGGRPAPGDEPHGPPRPGPHVLRTGGLRGAGHRPRQGPRPARGGAPLDEEGRARPTRTSRGTCGWACARTGCWPASAWAWPSAPSGTAWWCWPSSAC